MTNYQESGQWLVDLERARENYTITGHQRKGDVRWVEAEAGTGSRYTVVTTRLPTPWAAITLGSDTLVSLVHPRRSAYAMKYAGGSLHSGYVREKLFGLGRLHAGDLYAVTVTVALALDREAFIDGYEDVAVTSERMAELNLHLSAPRSELLAAAEWSATTEEA